jgi:hypothetical protein
MTLSSTRYDGVVAPAATYTIALACKMPTCTVSFNGRQIASVPYKNFTQLQGIYFYVNGLTQTATGSAQFSRFKFSPAS